MRDIYKTAKKAQLAPVRGRVKAMMAQPRAVAQARKVARQTTGFKKGGVHKLNGSSLLKYDQIFAEEQEKAKKKAKKKLNGKQAGGKISTPMTHDSDFTRWFESQYGGTEKGKPHSTLEGRSAAGRRYMRRAEKYWTKRREEDKKRKDDPHHPREKRGMGPRAPSRPRPKAGPPAESPREYQDPFKKQKEEEGMYVKKGGVVQKAFLGKLMSKLGIGKGRTGSKQEALAGQDYKRMRPEPTHEQTVDVFKKHMGYKKGAVMKKKKVDKKWIQKAVNPKHKGYCTPMTKKTCTPARKALARTFKKKAKKGWANGGTVVMPTVGNDVRVRAYKHGAVIHPRPKPTTVAHGRMRGVGIANRGW